MTNPANLNRLGKTRQRRSSSGAQETDLSTNRNRTRLQSNDDDQDLAVTTDAQPNRLRDDAADTQQTVLQQGNGSDVDFNPQRQRQRQPQNSNLGDDGAIAAAVNLQPVANPRNRQRRNGNGPGVNQAPNQGNVGGNQNLRLGNFVNGVKNGIRPGYQAAVPNLTNWQTIDPFGKLSQDPAPNSPLRDYDFGQLSAAKGSSFLRAISLTNQLPGNINDIAPGNLADGQLSNGVPPLQHSIWVGNPLNADNPKQKRFMDALARNKRENPNWTVVLWTDQTRANLDNAAADSLQGKMRQWAIDNNIVLANIDEVFSAGNNKMSLNAQNNFERLRGGPGRAAASDITRLEVLNRFGGLYVDGDKPVWNAEEATNHLNEKNGADQAELRNDGTILDRTTNFVGTPLDFITQHTANNVTQITTDNGGTANVNGFAAGQDLSRGAHQNCALCATKGNVLTGRILAKVRSNYGKSREQLRQDNLFLKPGRFQRTEVIERTGPSAVRDGLERARLFIPDRSVNTASGGVSWTGESAYQGLRDPRNLTIAQVNNPNLLNNLQTQAQQVVNSVARPPQLPVPGANDLQVVTAAVQNGLAVLNYAIANENGRLDLNYLKKHLQGLTPAQQQLAFHTTLETLTQPEFAGLADKITKIRLPTPDPNDPTAFQVSRETLDLMGSDAFPKVDLTNYTVQDAVLAGNLSFLRYANENNLLNQPTKEATQYIDAGTTSRSNQSYLTNPNDANLEAAGFAGDAGLPDGTIGGKFDVLRAALDSRNPNVLNYLSAIGALDNLAPARLTKLLKNAIARRQLDTAVAIALNTGSADVFGNLLQAAPKNLRLPIFQRFYQQFGGGLSRDTDNITRLLEAAVYSTLGQAQDIARGFDDLDASFTDLNNKNFLNFASLRLWEKRKTLTPILAKVTNEATATAALVLARKFGFEDDLLVEGAKQNNYVLITTRLNQKRAEELNRPTIGANQNDPDAQLAIAHSLFPNSERGKNAHRAYRNDNNVELGNLSMEDARAVIQQGLVYAHDRLRANTTGGNTRMSQWSAFLTALKQVQAPNPYRDLFPLIDQTQTLFTGMRSGNTQTKQALQAEAQSVVGGAPPLSARAPASSVRRAASSSLRSLSNLNIFSSSTNVAVAVNEPEKIFVPGKGMVPVSDDPT